MSFSPPTGGTQVTTTLGQNFTINSLTFNNNATSTSNISGNTLTLNAGSGDGITVDSGSGSHTISSNIALGATQTWTNNSVNTLTASGVDQRRLRPHDRRHGHDRLHRLIGQYLHRTHDRERRRAGLEQILRCRPWRVTSTVTGGTAKLLGNNQISTGSSVTVSGGTLAMQGFNNTVSGVQLAERLDHRHRRHSHEHEQLRCPLGIGLGHPRWQRWPG